MKRFSQLSSNAQGILLILLAILIFALMDAIAKYLTQHYPTVQIVWARNAGQLVLVLALLAHNIGPYLRTNYPGLHVLRSLLQLGAALLFFTALSFIGLAEATAIWDLNPVLITLGAALFLGERIGIRRLLGVLSALCGALIIIRPGGEVFSPYAFLPLLGAVCYAGYAIVTRIVGREESPWTAMLYTALLGTVLTGFALPWAWRTPELADLPRFILLGALGAVAQLCMIRAFSIAEAAVIAPFGYAGVLFATLWGILFFGEYPDIWTMVGALVIVASGLYVWHRETQAAHKPGH